MFKLKTQDGRTLDISRDYRLFISGNYKSKSTPAQLTVTTFTKGDYFDINQPEPSLVQRYGVIGTFATNTAFKNAVVTLREAWDKGSTEFNVPQDSPFKSMDEQFDDFCEEHHLICVSINELGYKPSDIPRNIHIWKTTSDFERRNILVADPTAKTPADAWGGVYAKSFAKWQALKTA